MKNKQIAIIGALLFASLFNNIERALYQVVPMKFWVEYKNVHPHNEYFIGDNLVVISDATYKRAVDVEFKDVLRCVCEDKINGCDETGFYTYSVYPSGKDAYYPKSQTQAWVFLGQIPDFPTQCLIKSSIKINLPQGVKKTQVIYGSIFNINERKKL